MSVHNASASNWVSLSDMMTGLMLVFLLISILTISQVVQREQERTELLDEYKTTKADIYNELKDTFEVKETVWGIEISKDLSVKFENPEVLFAYRSAELTPDFVTILDEFIPMYLEIINKPKYADTIKEVRIEGHTADWDDYMYTITLSQDRSNTVLGYILDSKDFYSLSLNNQEKVKFWLVAAGLGKGRTLDNNGAYTFYTKNKISANSRRVEFRIITRSDELIEEIISRSK